MFECFMHSCRFSVLRCWQQELENEEAGHGQGDCEDHPLPVPRQWPPSATSEWAQTLRGWPLNYMPSSGWLKMVVLGVSGTVRWDYHYDDSWNSCTSFLPNRFEKWVGSWSLWLSLARNLIVSSQRTKRTKFRRQTAGMQESLPLKISHYFLQLPLQPS